MQKDPAFLFYSSDFITGTLTMSNEEIGMYVRILCMQHQTCHLDAKTMQTLCGGIVPPAVLAKFTLDPNGKYYNERLESEMIKRQEKGKKNKKNAEARWDRVRNANALPFINENVNENEIENNNIPTNVEKGGTGEKTETINLSPASMYHPDQARDTREGIYEITRYLNTKTGGTLNPEHPGYCSSIWRRLQDGYTFDQMRAIIDTKVAEWINDRRMRIHLNPTTLFSEENFDKYLNETTLPPIKEEESAPRKAYSPSIDHIKIYDQV